MKTQEIVESQVTILSIIITINIKIKVGIDQ